MENISDPIPPEYSFLYSSQNFREVVLKKLNQAKKQKQSKQRGKKGSDNLQPAPSSHPQWEQQRVLLLDMLQKTQQMLMQTQQSKMKQNNDQKQNFKQMQNQITNLRIENKELKSKIGKSENTSTSGLLKQIEKLQQAAIQSEKKHQQDIRKLQSRLVKNPKQAVVRQTLDLQKLGANMEQINTLKSENDKLKKKMETIMKMVCEKQANLLEQLQVLNKKHQQTQQKTLKYKSTMQRQQELIQELTIQIDSNKEEMHAQLAQALKAARQQDQQALQLFSLLNKKIAKVQNSQLIQSMNEKIKKLQVQLNDKQKELELQQMENQILPPTFNELQDIKRGILKLNKSFQQLDTRSRLSEQSRISQIHSLNDQLQQAQISVSSRTEPYLQSKLSSARNEISHAKRLIIHYIRSIQQLQSEIKLGNNPENLRMQLEIQRLSEQNKSLVQLKSQSDRKNFSLMNEMKSQLDQKNSQIQSLKQKISDIESAYKQQNLTELQEAYQRLDAALSLNKQLQTNIQAFDYQILAQKYQQSIQQMATKLQISKQTILNLKDEYLHQKQDLVKRIQELQIAMKNQQVKEVVSEVTQRYQDLINCIDTFKDLFKL